MYHRLSKVEPLLTTETPTRCLKAKVHCGLAERSRRTCLPDHGVKFACDYLEIRSWYSLMPVHFFRRLRTLDSSKVAVLSLLDR